MVQDKVQIFTKKRALAVVISRLFGPFTVIPLWVGVVLFFHTDLGFPQQLRLFPIILAANYVLPAAWLLFFLVSRRISDVDITDREQRGPLFLILTLHGWIGVLFGFLLGATREFNLLMLYGMAVFSIVVILTNYDKVSLHTAGFVTASIITNVTFGWQYWWLFFLVIFIAWARLVLKKHNLRQLVIGAIVPVIVFLTGALLMLQ